MNRRFLRLCLVLPILLGAIQCSQKPRLELPAREVIQADADNVTDPTEIVVLAADVLQMNALVKEAGGVGYSVLRARPLTSLGMVMSVLRIPQGRSGEAAIDELEGLLPGVTAGVNHAYPTGSLQSGRRGRLYANTLLGWPSEGCVPRQPIGIIDAAGPGIVPPARFRSFTATPGSDAQHGAFVAALLTQQGRLDAPDLYVANVIGESRRGRSEASVDAIVAALDWLQSEGVRLVNVSLAGPYNKILDLASTRASQRGMVIVAAAGNDGAASPPRYPAAFSKVIAVTAVDANMAPYAQAVVGPHIDIAAPGVDLFVGGRYVSGSSFAAPFVTAFLASADPSGMTADRARGMLRAGVTDLGAPGKDPVFGDGLLSLQDRCAGG